MHFSCTVPSWEHCLLLPSNLYSQQSSRNIALYFQVYFQVLYTSRVLGIKCSLFKIQSLLLQNWSHAWSSFAAFWLPPLQFTDHSCCHLLSSLCSINGAPDLGLFGLNNFIYRQTFLWPNPNRTSKLAVHNTTDQCHDTLEAATVFLLTLPPSYSKGLY